MSATLTVNSTASSSLQPRTPQLKVPPALPQSVEWPWLLAGFLGLATLMILTTSKRRPVVWLFVTVLLVAGAWVACGGSGGGGGGGPAPTPVISLSSTSLNFGQVGLGSASAPQTVTLTNTGNATLNLGSVAITGDYPDFALGTDSCFDAAVAPGGKCITTLTFSPQATGLRSGVLNFPSPSTAATVSLSGTGIQPPTPPGNYFVQILAETAANDVGHQLELTLTVQ